MVVRRIEGSTDKRGDEFSYQYQDVHRSKQKDYRVIPAKKSFGMFRRHLNFVQDKTEWKARTLL